MPRSLFSAAVAVVACAAPPVGAVPLVYRVDFVVGAVTGDLGDVEAGDPFSLLITVDSESDPRDATPDDFRAVLPNGTFTGGDRNPVLSATDDPAGDEIGAHVLSDTQLVAGSFEGADARFGGIDGADPLFRFRDEDGTAIAGSDLPRTLPPLPAWETIELPVLEGVEGFGIALVDSSGEVLLTDLTVADLSVTVPEPDAGALGLLALALSWALRRRAARSPRASARDLPGGPIGPAGSRAARESGERRQASPAPASGAKTTSRKPALWEPTVSATAPRPEAS